MITRSSILLSITVLGLNAVFSLIPHFQSPFDPWSEPFNISQSGAASQPAMVVDQAGIVNVVWLDKFNGQMLSSFSDGVWSEPQAVAFPFGISEPRFIFDDNGYIHAFWVSDSNSLLYSRVLSDRFGNSEAWVAPQILAASAVKYDISIDSQGFLHLGYVRVIDADGVPAGIYYKRSLDSGSNWSAAEKIYNSDYFRSLTSENTNIDLSSSHTAEFTNVFITWDIQPRRQSFYIQSTDGGETWGTPIEIGSLYPNAKKQNYTNIRAVSVRDDIILLWQEDFSSAGCSQSYAFSRDVGVTWSEPHSMLGNLRGCALDNAFIGELDGYPILQTSYQNEIYLSIWTGNVWSDPLLQRGLVRFLDPQTAQTTALAEQKLHLLDQNQMIMVGVDASDLSDVWLRTRDISGVQDWFPSEGSWNDPAVVYSRDNPIHAPVMVGGLGEKLHQFWSEIDPTQDTLTREAIFYSEWDGEDWSMPTIIARSPDGSAVNPRVVVDSANRFFLIWGDPQNGDLFFSWANESLAKGPAEWTEPVALPSFYMISGGYDIAVDSSEAIYVVYAVRLNEGRGIYLTRSSDLGKSWSEPVQIFDGVARKWLMVDDPRISITSEGKLAVAWTRYNLPGTGDSLGIYTSYSQDGGVTWSDELLISGENVSWSQLAHLQAESIFGVWQIVEPGFHATMFTRSQDGGLSWSQPQSIGSTWESQGVVAITQDQGGKLHLIKQMPENTDDTVLVHWEWDGTEWMQDENSIVVSSGDITGADSIAAAVSQDGTLGILLYGLSVPDEENQVKHNLVYVSRTVEVLAGTFAGTVPTPGPTVAPTEEFTLTQEPAPDQANELPVINRQPANLSFANNYTGAVFGVIITVVLVLIAFGWRMYRVSRREKTLMDR